MTETIRSGLLTLGIHAIRRTEDVRVLALIKKLRPLDCGIDLIRLGGRGDGGYLIPDDLEGIEYCFSPGVNTVSNFENELAELGIRSFLADYSVDGPPITRPEFTFDKKFVGASDRENYMTLESWKEKYIKDYWGELILQMDIEGSEYEVILNTPDKILNQFRIMAIEFHYLDHLFDPFAFSLLSSCFEKILEHFHVIHIHPNNVCGVVSTGDIKIPKILEFTFINKRRVVSTKLQRVFPHKLDVDNTTSDALSLPKCWYSTEE